MKNIIGLIFLSLLVYSCKKKEERDLVRQYEGAYLVKHTQTWCCDSLMHTQSATDDMELYVKKSSKGVRIKGVEQFDNFDVNYHDSTLSVKSKDHNLYVWGKLLPGDSIALVIRLSAKLPFAHYYFMKKK